MEAGTKRMIFMDLDGVLFGLVDHCGETGVSARTEDEITIVEGLDEFFSRLVERGYTLVGVTNQPDIARGKITSAFLTEKHRRLLDRYPQLSEIFVCPHTDTDLCRCRKPKLGLFEQAGLKYGVNFSASWTIGDSRSDIEAGHATGTSTILVQTAWNSESSTAVLRYVTAVAKSTHGALKLILALDDKYSNSSDV